MNCIVATITIPTTYMIIVLTHQKENRELGLVKVFATVKRHPSVRRLSREVIGSSLVMRSMKHIQICETTMGQNLLNSAI
eukprot:scaffold8114_cov126-Cylindrotheca_fusiformis.AAC.13